MLLVVAAPSLKILGVMSDLFFSVKILDEAGRLGMSAEFVKDQALALEKIKNQPPLVIFDLNCAGAGAVEILRAMKADPLTRAVPTLGFVAHVQVELKQEALAAGCDVVVARSVFAQSLPELLRGQLTQAV